MNNQAAIYIPVDKFHASHFRIVCLTSKLNIFKAALDAASFFFSYLFIILMFDEYSLVFVLSWHKSVKFRHLDIFDA